MTSNKHRNTDSPRRTKRSPNPIVELKNAWADGVLPSVATFVDQHQVIDVEVIADLVREDMVHRIEHGMPAQLEGYLDRLPQLRNAPLEVVALILDEYSCRSDAGQAIGFDEYARRFPDHVETLRFELASFDMDESVSAAELLDRAKDSAASSEGSRAVDRCRQKPTVEVGATIGDFLLEELLGTGGVSKVYRARQLSLDRDVALKVTVQRARDENHEGRMMASLVHDHIVPVHTEQTVDSLRVLAMGYVAGPTLAEFMYEVDRDACRSAIDCLRVINELSPNQADPSSASCIESGQSKDRVGTRTQFVCRTIRNLASALSHAHRQGVLHCDVKPANVLFAPDGRAMLTDFNVSVRPCECQTESIPPGGTLPYMSPEHLGILSGTDREIELDARADIYSLGLVFFELLTGRWPFCEFNVSSDPLAAAAHLQAARISHDAEMFVSSDDASPGLRSILKKCLAPERENRYQSAESLVEDLDRFLTNRPLRFADDPSRLERIVKRLRRQTVSIIATTAVIGLLIASGLAWSNRGQILTSSETTISNVQRASDFEAQGQGFFLSKQFDNAALCFMQAVQLNANSVTAHHNLAVAQFRLGRFVDAVESFDRVIELGNRSALIYSRRAAARFGIGDVAGAESDFIQAERLATNDELDEVRANKLEFDRRQLSVSL